MPPDSADEEQHDEPPEASKDKGGRKDKTGKKGKSKKDKKGKKQRDNEEALASGSPDGDGTDGEGVQTEANPMGARLL